MITYAAFIAQFPEFGYLGQGLVTNVINQTEVEVNDYDGVVVPVEQVLAVMLHVAHNLVLKQWAIKGYSGSVIKIASQNDSIEFAVNPNVGLSLDSTMYGVRLQTLIRRANTVFTVS